MTYYRLKQIILLLLLLALIGLGYFYRQDIGHIWRRLITRIRPCQEPITYSIGNLDERFGLTEAELLADTKKAEDIWEAPIDKQLFAYSPTGDLKINLVYDYRQQATDALKKIGVVINNDRSTYDSLKAKHDTLVASYKSEKTKIDALIATYNEAKSAYEKEVRNLNSHGGASEAEFAALEQKRADLNKQITAINEAENSLNQLVDTIKSIEAVLNRLVTTLNLQVDSYNAVGASTGKEFDEGEYVSSAGATTINIFQFNDDKQLVRVLAHELGHALGLPHLNDPQAMMYYLNEGGSDKLTAADLTALKKICRIN